MNKRFIRSLMISTSLVAASFAAANSYAAADTAIPVAQDGIGGVVTSSKGPEAGVWVIAQTSDLSTSKFLKIVVTDDQGRFFLPELPKAKYEVFVRGYGLVDSKPVAAALGKSDIKLTAIPAPDAKTAAQIYPPNYWFSLIKMPDASEFPGTGPKGNGIAPGMKTQQNWVNQASNSCQVCHQLGTAATRNLENNTAEGWAERINKARGDGDQALSNHGPAYANSMNNLMTGFGRQRGLNMWADWTQRIAKGELPKEAPPRPQGIERNVVLTQWDWANGRYVHDISLSDRHDPTVNANGPVFGVVLWWGFLELLDPKTGKTAEYGYKVTPNKGAVTLPPEVLPDDRPHNPMTDKNGTVWLTDIGKPPSDMKGEVYPENLAFCTDPSNRYAKYYPQPGAGKNMAINFDPKGNKYSGAPMCNAIHHLQFSVNRKDLYFSGGNNKVVSWLDIDEWAKTKDPAKAVGWCPMVVDSNATDPSKRPSPGDITITADRASWNDPGVSRGNGEEAPADDGPKMVIDPKKDTRVQGFLYGVDADVSDGSMWFAKTAPFPTQLVRFNPGSSPPETCHTEMYEPPVVSGSPDYVAFGQRGVSVDSKGVAFGFTGNGQLTRFERAKCKNVAGLAAATGQQCPEGWSVYDAPGPKMAGVKSGTADFHYLGWVDLHDTLGFGKDTVITAGSNSDSLLAFNDTTRKYSVIRVPYPLGFRTRGIDGRIDDAKAGWKGKGAWGTYSSGPVWHMEGGGDGDSGPFMVKFQTRPSPLSN